MQVLGTTSCESLRELPCVCKLLGGWRPYLCDQLREVAVCLREKLPPPCLGTLRFLRVAILPSSHVHSPKHLTLYSPSTRIGNSSACRASCGEMGTR